MRWEVWQEDYWIPQKDRTNKNNLSNDRRWKKSRLKKRNAIRKRLVGWERAVAEATPKFSQAQHLIEKFNGIVPFSIAVGIHPTIIITSWLNYSIDGLNPSRGRYATHGLIPTRHLVRLIMVSRYWGILIRPHDVYPDFVGEHGLKNFHNNEEIRRWILSMNPSTRMKLLEHDVASLVAIPE